MLRIRFRRMGLKRQPTYRIVVTDQRNSRDGGFLEIIGYHNPRTRPGIDVVDEGRVLYWLSVGGQASEAVKGLLKRTGSWARYERLMKGETLESLIAEAEVAKANATPVSPRTSYPAPAAGQGRKALAAAAAAKEE
ncbi:MAG: 30S ribosomal protein S16 [Chitinophagaceae bacterium]|nr:30S ribosomal protein S16 [Anaerolineae bacterium]